MSFVTGVGLTAYGRHEGKSTLDLMSEAASLAIADAGLARGEIDGILCGYSTTMPHIMLATVFAEHFGIKPAYCHAVQVGGATGMAMMMLAHHVADAGLARPPHRRRDRPGGKCGDRPEPDPHREVPSGPGHGCSWVSGDHCCILGSRVGSAYIAGQP